MAHRAEMRSPTAEPDRRWLGLVQTAAVACALLLMWLIGVLPRAATAPFKYQDWMGHLLFYPLFTVPYWISLWWLRRKKPGSLAWAVGTGLGGFVFLMPFVPLVANHYEEPAWRLITISSGLLLLAQVIFLAGAAITYFKMPQECRAKRPLLVGGAAAGVCVFIAALSMTPPSDIHKRQHSSEASAVGTLRELSRALELYEAKCAGYPSALSALAPPGTGRPPDCARMGSIEEAITPSASNPEWRKERAGELTRLLLGRESPGERFGYRFSYKPSEPVVSEQPGAPFYLHYQINADPLQRGKTGFRSFCVSDGGTIRLNWEAPAGPTDPAWD